MLTIRFSLHSLPKGALLFVFHHVSDYIMKQKIANTSQDFEYLTNKMISSFKFLIHLIESSSGIITIYARNNNRRSIAFEKKCSYLPNAY